MKEQLEEMVPTLEIPSPLIERQTEECVELSGKIKRYSEQRGITDKITQVPLYQGARIDIGPDDPNQVLITENLNGCSATIIWTESSDHLRSAQLVHFPPFMLDRHLQKIKDLIKDSDLVAFEKHALLYLSSRRRENEFKIIECMQSELGKDLQITIRFYEEKTDDESGILAVELKSGQDGEVIYHLGKDRLKA
jgi:hypothetical protein